MGHLCNKFGLTEIQSSRGRRASNTVKESRFKPQRIDPSAAAHNIRPFPNPLSPALESQNVPLFPSMSPITPDIERWRSARDMFTQYHISRPSGWLSDISLGGDGNASPPGYCRYCHICSAPVWAPTHCSSCGHHLCDRCACEVLATPTQAHASRSHHLAPTTARDDSKHISASKPNPESIQTHGQESITTVSATGDRNQSRREIRHRPSSNFRPDSSWLKTNKQHGENMISYEISAPIMRDHSHISEEQFEQTQSRLTPAIKVNPLVLNDKKDKKQEVEKNRSIPSMGRMECDDPICRATHTGHHPFRHSVSCSKHGSEHSKRAQDFSSASNKRLEDGVFEEFHSDTNSPTSHLHDVHRHHSAGFHSNDHIAEHLSSAVGHNAYDLLKGRKKKNIQPASKASIKSRVDGSPYLEPLTQPKSLTQMESFKWTQDTLPAGHPSRLSDRRQRPSPLTKEAASTSDHQQHINASERTTHDAINTVSGEATFLSEQRELHSDLNLSRRDNILPRLRLASTPSWLRNPAKKAADAIAPLHHIDTKNHEMHEHDHGYLSNVAIHSHDDHDDDHRLSRSSNKTGTRAERHLPSKILVDAPSVMAEAPGSVHATPKIRIDPAAPERRQRHAPAPEAKDTHLHSDTRAGHEENTSPKLLHTPLRPQVSSKAFTPTTNRSNQELEHHKGLGRSLVEQSPELEIAKPMPIAPPNHECAWKDRYLALTAEIRQLKAEMSTRASHRSSEFVTLGYKQHGDDHDLLGVTVNLHFRDRDDIVIGTDVARGMEPHN
ncbi:hypothetical protein GGR51DRAFT_572801 [Nemania sp. FL0031]|nr:hypothetical protein GGR51DRAFT_572801 [Nemania sp. FL0031]